MHIFPKEFSQERQHTQVHATANSPSRVAHNPLKAPFAHGNGESCEVLKNRINVFIHVPTQKVQSLIPGIHCFLIHLFLLLVNWFFSQKKKR